MDTVKIILYIQKKYTTFMYTVKCALQINFHIHIYIYIYFDLTSI